MCIVQYCAYYIFCTVSAYIYLAHLPDIVQQGFRKNRTPPMHFRLLHGPRCDSDVYPGQIQQQGKCLRRLSQILLLLYASAINRTRQIGNTL